MVDNCNQTELLRKASLWLTFGFYFLIAFEFFYMISPFAVYLYSVYGPGLELFARYQATNWLNITFLPHVVMDTHSIFLNNVVKIGLLLFSFGLLLFFVGAGQIYWGKLRRKAAVCEGLYFLVRHPQYSALMFAGFGMLLLWPRYIVLVSYVSMLFIYVLLARFEEKECLRKFGSSYRKYHIRTPMFFPLFNAPADRKARSCRLFGKIGRYTAMYVLVMSTAILGASSIQSWALNQLYAEFRQDSVNISAQALDPEVINAMLALALDNQQARRLIARGGEKQKYINYIVPINWSASEIPMRQVVSQEHFNFDQNDTRERYKIIITRAVLSDPNATGKEIVGATRQRIPLAEVTIDFHTKEVLDVQGPATEGGISGIPLPMF
ncbi:MAG: methyltransferase [Desulfoprunum sp.]|nr:methyltransferase [Desulfoprunum sp.]